MAVLDPKFSSPMGILNYLNCWRLQSVILESNDDKISIFNILTAAYSHEFAYSGNGTLLDTLIAGRKNPGSLERAYYQKYELPWEEARRSGRA